MLHLNGLRKTFGSIVAVSDLSLEIHAGEVFGLLGPNGAGKSTTIGMATGLLTPDAGSVEVDGAGSPVRPAVRRRLGIAPQALALYEELSGEENVTFFGRLQGLADQALRESTRSALDFVGLLPRRRDRVKTYSGGMKRRLNLAVALVHDPPLLLLDEPTAGVDPQSRHAIFDNIRALRDKGRTVLFTTHYMEEAQRLCDRVGVLDRGILLALGSPQQLIETHGGKPMITAETDAGIEHIDSDQPIRALERLQSEGRLVSFHVERPNLEQVFLKLTGRYLRD
jgi:ABC-2 type transport system ATP-binding protein